MYDLDPQLAKEGDAFGFITESGPYTGVFTLAREIISPEKGTKGIEFQFKSAEGAEAKNIQIWTISADGKRVFGYNMLMALMTCMKLKCLTASQQVVPVYDYEQQAEVPTQVTVFNELMNRPVGVVLQREEYQNRKGEVKFKMTLFRAFNAETHQTASEILDQMPAEKLDKIVKRLVDKKLKQQQHDNAPPAHHNQIPDCYTDDIPF